MAITVNTNFESTCLTANLPEVVEIEATRFCLVYSNLENSNKSKTEYDGSRIYVGLPSHVFSYGNPEPEYRDVGTTAHVSCLYQTALRKSKEILA